MNKLVVRLHAPEYGPGEVTYGAVYLCVATPTAGCGVRLKFTGTERFTYGTDGYSTVKDNKEYVDLSEIILYTKSTPFPLGNYMIPFQFKLLNEIPGSFEGVGPHWTASIAFVLEAKLIDAENIKCSQPIIIKHVDAVERQCGPRAVCVEHKVRQWLGMLHHLIHITARFHDRELHAGESARLQLIITNPTTVEVTAIHVKLKQNIQLITGVNAGDLEMLAGDSRNVLHMNRKLIIQPDGDVIVRELVLQGRQNRSIFNRAIDNLLIPLETGDKLPLCPTTHGQHIQCRYAIDVQAHLDNGDTIELCLPLGTVLPARNDQFIGVRPEWSKASATILAAQNPYTVTEEDLGSELFSQLYNAG